MLVANHSVVTLRPLNLDEDYPLLMEWWRVRGGTLLVKEIFPGTGAVAYVDNRPVAMSFLYCDRDGRLAFIEWTSTNPAKDIRARNKLAAVKALFEHLTMEARLFGCSCVLSLVAPNGSEDHLLKKMGWAPSAQSDVPHVMFGKRLR